MYEQDYASECYLNGTERCTNGILGLERSMNMM